MKTETTEMIERFRAANDAAKEASRALEAARIAADKAEDTFNEASKTRHVLQQEMLKALSAEFDISF